MPSDEPALTAPRGTPSERHPPQRSRSGSGEVLAFLRAALLAIRDLWVADPPQPPVPPGEAGDAP